MTRIATAGAVATAAPPHGRMRPPAGFDDHDGAVMKARTAGLLVRNRVAVSMIWLLGCPVASVAQAVAPPSPDKGYIGLGWSFPLDLEEDESGVMRASGYSVVVQVDKCSPAEKAGFQVGDVLKVVSGRDGRIVPLFEGVNRPGTVHIVTVERGEEVLDLTMTIEEPIGEGETPADRCDSSATALCEEQFLSANKSPIYASMSFRQDLGKEDMTGTQTN